MKDKKYCIKVYYRTGDSFGSRDEDMIIELKWDNLDIAKENLQRIKQHYEWYTQQSNSYYEFREDKLEKPWFVNKRFNHKLLLKMDNGKEHDYSASTWCGYFETLYSAEIKRFNPEDEGISFTID